jgi:hypothetical protein
MVAVFGHAPGLVVTRFDRGIEAQIREPCFAGHGLNPVPFDIEGDIESD